MPSSAALRVFNGLSVRRNGSACRRDQAMGSFERIIVPNCRRRFTTRPSRFSLASMSKAGP